jgi:hypothetical protein
MKDESLVMVTELVNNVWIEGAHYITCYKYKPTLNTICSQSTQTTHELLKYNHVH